MKQDQRTLALAAAAFLALSFALMGVWVRMMQSSFAPFQQTYLRVAGAGLIAVVLWRKQVAPSQWPRLERRDWAVYVSRALIANVGGIALFTLAVEKTDIATVSFVTEVPLLGPLAWLMYRQRMTRQAVAWSAASILGLVLLSGVSSGAAIGAGAIFALASTIGFDVGFLMSKLHRHDVTNVQTSTLMLCIGWVGPFLISVATSEQLGFGHVSLDGWLGLALGSASNVWGAYLINFIFRTLQAYVAGAVLLAEGFFAAVLGWAFYGETLTAMAWLGAILIVIAAVAIAMEESGARPTATVGPIADLADSG